MAYTVKNGTWCKDNEKEYYSTTKAGLKAALAAGEITAGTKVVIHKPKYHAGQLIQSLNPECPEGCFAPHGQEFDTSIYEELAKIFPSGVLPDMRECVLVCVGENTHISTHEHDVFSAGEFKDDCAISHAHTITVNDPGHNHDVTDPGHGHDVTDPGHSHDVTDPGHDHSPGTYEITGDIHVIGKNFALNGKCDGAFSKLNSSGGVQEAASNEGGPLGDIKFKASDAWTGRTENVTTGVSVNDNTTGISIGDNTTGVSVNDNTTGITADCSSTGDTVTRTKQFGVYYYIAF